MAAAERLRTAYEKRKNWVGVSNALAASIRGTSDDGERIQYLETLADVALNRLQDARRASDVYEQIVNVDANNRHAIEFIHTTCRWQSGESCGILQPTKRIY